MKEQKKVVYMHIGGGPGNPLQCSYLENPMDRGAGGLYSSWGHKELDMTKVTWHAFVAGYGVYIWKDGKVLENG